MERVRRSGAGRSRPGSARSRLPAGGSSLFLQLLRSGRGGAEFRVLGSADFGCRDDLIHQGRFRSHEQESEYMSCNARQCAVLELFTCADGGAVSGPFSLSVHSSSECRTSAAAWSSNRSDMTADLYAPVGDNSDKFLRDFLPRCLRWNAGRRQLELRPMRLILIKGASGELHTFPSHRDRSNLRSITPPAQAADGGRPLCRLSARSLPSREACRRSVPGL